MTEITKPKAVCSKCGEELMIGTYTRDDNETIAIAVCRRHGEVGASDR